MIASGCRVVAGTALATLRTRRRRACPKSDKHLHRAVLHRDIHIDDFPRWFKSEELGVQVTVLHLGMLP